MTNWKPLNPFNWALAITLALLSLPRGVSAEDDAPPRADEIEPALAKFITVTSPVDDVMSGKVKNTALALQNRALKENRQAVLILEVTPGTSQFHQVLGLTKFLTSPQVSKVTTVAWIPETVTGNNVVLALACKEIIMYPDAELGDIGRGKLLDPLDQEFVLSRVKMRYNKKLSPALALGMMDPQVVVLKIQRQVGPPGNETTDTQVVTLTELRRLVETKAVILKRDTIKEAGVVGRFSGQQARALDILVVQTAESRADIAKRYNLPRAALREDATSGEKRRVRHIQIDGLIEPVLETFVERQIQRSVAEGANLIIFEIDSNGGFLLSSQNLANAIADLDPKVVHTVAYIREKALSGAAIIAFGCDEIYMHPDAITGDAGPIELGEGGQFERAPEKILGLLREFLKQLAERKNRPPALLAAMADKDLKVFKVKNRDTGREWFMSEEEIHDSNGEWIKGDLVPETKEGLLSTVNGRRAHELKLAEPPVDDWDDLKQRLGVPPNDEPVKVGRTWVDTLVFLLNTKMAMFLLIVAGVACLYLEVHLVTGLLGILSVLCFALFFWSRFLGGTAGWLEVVLFLLGLVCLGLEIFVIPGFGVFGVSGGLLILASLVLASQTFGDFGGPQTDFGRMSRTVGTLGASLCFVVVLAMLMSRYLPEIPILNQMILAPPGSPDALHADEPRLRPELAGESAGGLLNAENSSLIGEIGVATSILRPAGKVEIAGRFVDVVSDGPYVQRGSRVEVIEVNGNRIVVREV